MVKSAFSIADIPEEWLTDRRSPVPLFKQLASSIRWSISTGLIQTGQTLPPVQQIISTLGVSISTVRAAYKVLESEGLLVSRPRHGTAIVALPKPDVGTAIEPSLDPSEYLSRAVREVMSIGYDKQLISDILGKIALGLTADPTKIRVVFTECTALESSYLATHLARDLDIIVEPVEIDALEGWIMEHMQDPVPLRAIATTFFHHNNVLALSQRYGIPTYGVVVEADPDEMERMAAMPADARIGIFCRAKDSVQYLSNKARVLAGPRPTRLVLVEDLAAVQDVLAWGDAFLMTHGASIVVRQLAPQATLFLFYARINEQSREILREALARLGAV